MPDHLPAEMTDAQKLEFMREWLMNVSWAMRDLRAGIQILHEKNRWPDSADGPSQSASGA
jgi:hypothetical protein